MILKKPVKPLVNLLSFSNYVLQVAWVIHVHACVFCFFFSTMQWEPNRDWCLNRVNLHAICVLFSLKFLLPLLPSQLIFSVFLCCFVLSWSSHLSLDPAEEYKMNNQRRGLALIFNQERFFWRLGMNDRHGTNADRYNLEKRYHFPARRFRSNTAFGITVLSSRTFSMTVVTFSKNFQCFTQLISPLF